MAQIRVIRATWNPFVGAVLAKFGEPGEPPALNHALFDGLVRLPLFGQPAIGRRPEVSSEVFPRMVLEQTGRADVAGEDVQALVTALLLHLPDRRPGLGGAGQEPRPQ